MTTQLIIDIAKRINQIDPRISAVADGGAIEGTFRGKSSETYSYIVSSRSFRYNNSGSNITRVIEQAISELVK